MVTYDDTDGKSGILSFEVGEDYIVVKFKRGRETNYKYTYSSAGENDVEKMKSLARMGSGLNSFIGKHAIDTYESKW